jgi:hypothetical protein
MTADVPDKSHVEPFIFTKEEPKDMKKVITIHEFVSFW